MPYTFNVFTGKLDYYSIATSTGGVETPVGNVGGGNKTFTVSNVPLWVTVDGQAIYENNGYTLSVLTITMDNAPLSGQILRSHF